jgi:hypothetical protein
LTLQTETYAEHVERLPSIGRHIIAQYDDESIIVYQAYRPRIGNFATEHGYFGGEFSLNRMSWIKPNFLWMMYRSDWGTKVGQEVVLAVRLQRVTFDQILSLAVHSSFVEHLYGTQAKWNTALRESSVRLQWDPDHDPAGGKLERRAIQLGLRDEILQRYSKEWIIDIQDISDFVAEQRQYTTQAPYTDLFVPVENIYPVQDEMVAKRLGIISS